MRRRRASRPPPPATRFETIVLLDLAVRQCSLAPAPPTLRRELDCGSASAAAQPSGEREKHAKQEGLVGCGCLRRDSGRQLDGPRKLDDSEQALPADVRLREHAQRAD